MAATIDPLPDAPQRTDTPQEFDDKADPFVAALDPFGQQANVLADEVEVNKDASASSASDSASSASDSATSAGESAVSATESEASKDAADSTSSISKWITGQTLTEGENRWSPTSFLSFRVNKNLSSGANTEDPADDTDETNWVPLSPLAAQGAVVQVVSVEVTSTATGTTVIPFDDSIPQNTEGDQFMALTMTPIDAGSTLHITTTIVLEDTAGERITVALFVDSVASALSAVPHRFSNGLQPRTITFTHSLSAINTSQRTFKIRAGVFNTGTLRINGFNGARLYNTVCSSSITVTEVLP